MLLPDTFYVVTLKPAYYGRTDRFFFPLFQEGAINTGTRIMDHWHCKIFPRNKGVNVFSNQNRQEASDSSLINVLMLLPDTVLLRHLPGARDSHTTTSTHM
jgi:hypothetical protein